MVIKNLQGQQPATGCHLQVQAEARARILWVSYGISKVALLPMVFGPMVFLLVSYGFPTGYRCYVWLVGWLAGWLVGWLGGWLVGWLVAVSYTNMKLK